MQQNLNELYFEYLTGKLKRANFEGSIFNYLVGNQEKTCICHWKRDEFEDFISWFYPRLRTAVDSYHDTGSSFEAFFTKYLLVSSKEYRVRTTTKSIIEYSTWSARVPEMYVYDEPPAYIDNEAENLSELLIIDKKGRKNTRRILALIIKCYYYVSEDFAEKIAPLIGVDSMELMEMLNRIRKIREKKDNEIYLIKERIYCQFYRCIVYEKRMSLVEDNTAIYNKLKLQLKKARQRLEKMRRRMASIRTEATNRQVAEVIGITKGAVDASLHRLKAKWEVMSKKAELN